MWDAFRALTWLLAVVTIFTLCVILSAMGSGIPVIYFEFLAWCFYFGYGLYIAYKNKRLCFKNDEPEKDGLQESNVYINSENVSSIALNPPAEK